VRLALQVRRFYCLNEGCKQTTFAERFPQLVPAHGQRTERMTMALRAFAYALSAEAGARLAHRLNMAVSGDTLLRIARQTELSPSPTVRILGVDDWAFKRGYRYGTLLVDLEQHQPIDVLPDRTADTLAEWLKAHPEIEIVSRDRSSEYIAGITRGAPQAIQVADRWHLLRNLGDAVERALARHPKALRAAAREAHERQNDTTPTEENEESERSPNPDADEQPALTQRQMIFSEVKSMVAAGYSTRAIARKLQIHRETVARYRQFDELPKRTTPQNISTVMPYMAHIEKRWAEGCHNGKQLWREICELGFAGSYMSVVRALKRFRTGDGRKHTTERLSPSPRPLSPRQAKWLLVGLPDRLTDEQIVQRDALLECCPDAAILYPLAQRFMTMFRERQVDELDSWVEDALACGVPALRNFAANLRHDYAAIKAALSLPWSNGQVEGQVNRLKFIKRQMYGRANFDLLRLRVLHPP
jgi:transposase